MRASSHVSHSAHKTPKGQTPCLACFISIIHPHVLPLIILCKTLFLYISSLLAICERIPTQACGQLTPNILFQRTRVGFFGNSWEDVTLVNSGEELIKCEHTQHQPHHILLPFLLLNQYHIMQHWLLQLCSFWNYKTRCIVFLSIYRFIFSNTLFWPQVFCPPDRWHLFGLPPASKWKDSLLNGISVILSSRIQKDLTLSS